jgi:hypothetical protein
VEWSGAVSTLVAQDSTLTKNKTSGNEQENDDAINDDAINGDDEVRARPTSVSCRQRDSAAIPRVAPTKQQARGNPVHVRGCNDCFPRAHPCL